MLPPPMLALTLMTLRILVLSLLLAVDDIIGGAATEAVTDAVATVVADTITFCGIITICFDSIAIITTVTDAVNDTERC